MKTDLTPLMTWNTHTVFLSLVCEFETKTTDVNFVTVWDQRIKREDVANHQIDLSKEYIEYYLTDINKELKGKDVTIYLRYEIMTTVGQYYANKMEVASFRAPDKYFGASKR